MRFMFTLTAMAMMLGAAPAFADEIIINAYGEPIVITQGPIAMPSPASPQQPHQPMPLDAD